MLNFESHPLAKKTRGAWDLHREEHHQTPVM
jgi:hypothetical protein